MARFRNEPAHPGPNQPHPTTRKVLVLAFALAIGAVTGSILDRSECSSAGLFAMVCESRLSKELACATELSARVATSFAMLPELGFPQLVDGKGIR